MLGIAPDEIECYGKYKAKLSNELGERLKERKNGKLVLVTAINPTPAGEGKTTTTVGLGQALCKVGKKGNSCSERAVTGPGIWTERRSGRRRICPSGSYG